MTEDALNQAITSGTVAPPEADPHPASSDTPANPQPQPSAQQTDLNQFVPILVTLQSVQKYLTAPPTFIPQTFQDQIQFVVDTSGTTWLYFYANNEWNAIEVHPNEYGDGSDGDAIISVDTALSRDVFYNSLTIQAGVKFSPNGFKVYSRGPITIAGHVSIDGGAGGRGTDGNPASGNGSVGNGGPGGTAGTGIQTGSIKQPGNGVAGKDGLNGGGAGSPNTANGNPGSNEANSILPNNAAQGGKSGSGNIDLATGFTDNSSTGGTGGTATRTTKPSAIDIIERLINALGAIGCNPTPGSGAGGGGGISSNPGNAARAGGAGGGGSGAPAGITWFKAPSITVNLGGSITATGGDGGRGGDGGIATGAGAGGNRGGGGGGGGAPGNGGLILMETPNYTNNGTVTASKGNPGNGGTGNNGGANGSTANAGNDGQVVHMIP